MLARGHGTIINVSSIAAFGVHPGPGWATYYATKAYMNTFTQALAEEVRDRGVSLQALCPGITRTEIFAQAGLDWDFSTPDVMTAEAVVEASVLPSDAGDKCAVSRAEVNLLQAGRTWRNVLRSPNPPGTERRRGKQHVGEAVDA